MDSKTAFIAITGRPNAGKSSLLNALTGEKIAMVTDKPQTTRTRITGIVTKEETQYVFMDTPGIHKPKTRLGEHMNKAIRDCVIDVDVIIMISDLTRKINEAETILLKSFKKNAAVILLLNKTDLIRKKENIAQRIEEFSSLYDFNAIIPVSILHGDGTDLIWREIEKYAAEGPHYFPDDKLTDQPEKFLMSEIIREKILILMRDEIPHGIAVGIEQTEERTNKNGEDILDCSAVIYCERESHKGMIIGKQGAMLKKIGQLARTELEEFFRIKVNLQCRVKVKEDWRNKEGLIRNFGLGN